eukprot:GHVU01054369.1.p2 GENE.GHVU01054369.1~~GHVU01054369.1.p2  ORF type:complete len:110 (+),score=7.08 GHVU01054369.1:785-1114(+)
MTGASMSSAENDVDSSSPSTLGRSDHPNSPPSRCDLDPSATHTCDRQYWFAVRDTLPMLLRSRLHREHAQDCKGKEEKACQRGCDDLGEKAYDPVAIVLQALNPSEADQ